VFQRRIFDAKNSLDAAKFGDTQSGHQRVTNQFVYSASVFFLLAIKLLL
jgi:hypothetical protein